MLKLTVAMVAAALAGSAGAASWKDLRIDASSEAAYQQSLVVFNKELSPERRYVFQGALMDIWLRGTTDANAKQGQYTVADFYRELDGLSYEEVVTLTDPTGERAKQRQREATAMNRTVGPSPGSPSLPSGKVNNLPNEHATLDSGALMNTRQGGTTERRGYVPQPVN
jgi:hypothetical protein